MKERLSGHSSFSEGNDFDYIRRIETLAIFAGSVAHDYNNALTVILGNLSLARLEAQGNQELLDIIKDADKASMRIKKLTERLAAFSAGLKSFKTRFLLRDLIALVTEKALANFCGNFNIEIKDELCEIEGDKYLLVRALINIIDNAIEAAPSEGGIVSISAEKINVSESLSFKEIELSPGNYILIRVGDNGKGIDKGEINRIFDPYYTTRPNSEGLGLAMTYAVIKNQKGFIKAESEKLTGTVLSIYLPVI
ncbi:MAG: ATP-binding protein [Spirochaetota bacterium]